MKTTTTKTSTTTTPATTKRMTTATTNRMTTTRSTTKTTLVKTTSKRMTAAIKPTEKPFNRVAPSNYTNVCPPVSTELSGDLMDAMSKSVEQTILYKKAKQRLMEAREIVREIAEEGKEDREVINILKKDLVEKNKEIERLSTDFFEMQKQGNILKEEMYIMDITVATLRKELYNLKSELKSELSSADKKRLELSLMQIELDNTKASLVKSELSKADRLELSLMQIELNNTKASLVKSELSKADIENKLSHAVGYQKHHSLSKTTNSLHHLVLEKKLSDKEKELDDMKTSIGDRIRQQNEETILLMQRTLGNTLSKLEKEHFSTVEKKDREIKHLKHELHKVQNQSDRLKIVWGMVKKRRLYGEEIANADKYINNPNVKHPLPNMR